MQNHARFGQKPLSQGERSGTIPVEECRKIRVPDTQSNRNNCNRYQNLENPFDMSRLHSLNQEKIVDRDADRKHTGIFLAPACEYKCHE